jgi:transposase
MRLVQLCFDFYMIEAKPENLIGDRAYDSDPLDAELRKDGIEMIAPHRRNRSKPPTQDRRRLSRYMRRWLVERFFAWIQWQRRSPHSLGVPRLQFSRLCPTCLPRYPLQTILR